jgi:hypothetical protein
MVGNLSVEALRHFGEMLFQAGEQAFEKDGVVFAKVEVTLHLLDEGLFAGLRCNRGRHLGDDTTGRRVGIPG